MSITTDPWERIVAYFDPADPIMEAVQAYRAEGHPPPWDCLLLINMTTFAPQEVVRKRDLPKVTGLHTSALEVLIKKRELKPFFLHENGVAKGVTGASLTAFQLKAILREALGIEPNRRMLEDRAEHMRAASPNRDRAREPTPG
jgi:hypothetical protein